MIGRLQTGPPNSLMELFDQITPIFVDFADPKKRIFIGYLGLSVLIALAWLITAKRLSGRAAIGRVFDRKVWLSKSAIADYKIFVINRVFSLFISPLLLTQLAIATALFYALHGVDFLNRGLFDHWPVGVIVALFTSVMFIIDDFTKYLMHRWMHRYPVLWAIHKVHHSAETLTPVTVYRVHPLEGILYGSRSAVAQGATLAIFFFFFGDAVDLYTVLGANILSFAFHVTGSNLRHSHIDIRYWPWLEHILISPAQHQVHHSIAEEHYDKNFGVALAVWDWMFGSLHLSEKEKKLTFGLDESEASSWQLADIYFRPFADIARFFTRRAKRLKKRLIRQMSATRHTPAE